MNIFFRLSFVLVLLTSCAAAPGRGVHVPHEPPDNAAVSRPFIIADHKNMAAGETVPEWLTLFLEGRKDEIEAYEDFLDRFVFIGRNEGNSFIALNHWLNRFSHELDFPRLAAARIERRFSYGVPFPDQVYGAFYVELIRAASDAEWTGAVREDDFWIQRRFFSADEADMEIADSVLGPWEFFILVSIERPLFASQLEDIFRRVNPVPAPTRSQAAAINRVRERFFDGF